MKKPLVLLLLVAVAFGGYRWYQTRNATPEKTIIAPTYGGTVEIRRVNLAFRVGGQVAEMWRDEGDPAESGDLLAALDLEPFEADVAIAEARRNAAAANLARLENGSRPQEIAQAAAELEERRAARALAVSEFERCDKLLAKNAVSQSAHESAKMNRDAAEAAERRVEEKLSLLEEGARAEDLDAARATLAEAEAALKKTKIALADAELYAPNSGVLLTRVVEPGAIVQPGQTVATLSLTDVVWVYIFIEEPDLGKIAPGAVAEIRTDSSTKTYLGRVGYVSPEAEFTPKNVETPNLRTNLVYRARLVVENPDDGLRQGAPVDVVFSSSAETPDDAPDKALTPEVPDEAEAPETASDEEGAN
ncbi:MAG: efflux RND transporter periplasmic adaptor subunit [Thermoguttaceae bacterium]|nr:efflux RND transporter periplasmic adaptor subunit [Thermoguttaceae bacterium]